MDDATRRAGVLVHPSSLPGPFGIGDLGPATVRFLDWMVEAGLSVWQLLPLGPTGAGNSPYSSSSAFAGNPLLLSPHGLTPVRSARARAASRVGFDRVRRFKHELLTASWARFRRHASPHRRHAFEAFVEDPAQEVWLEDWALFAALKSRLGGRGWPEWDEPLRLRAPAALRAAGRELAGAVAFHRYVQFLFSRQWKALRAEAAARGISLMGDLPYYVALDSADVWAHRRLFDLDASGRPRRVAGVPPDAFSARGQLWGHPLYDWQCLGRRGYDWWIARVRADLRRFDLLRLDHFRGFAAHWSVAAQAATAAEGRWEPGPGRALFDALRDELGPLPLIAEDLGEITDDVDALRDELGLPGMHVLQFGVADPASRHHPRRHRVRGVVYTGTHDNDTTRGWFEALPPADRRAVLEALAATSAQIVTRMIEAAYASVAELAVVPLQDLLGLGSEARMNRPSRPDGNWEWRAGERALTLRLATRWRRLAAAARRASR